MGIDVGVANKKSRLLYYVRGSKKCLMIPVYPMTINSVSAALALIMWLHAHRFPLV
jgi:hypothetical protein